MSAPTISSVVTTGLLTGVSDQMWLLVPGALGLAAISWGVVKGVGLVKKVAGR